MHRYMTGLTPIGPIAPQLDPVLKGSRAGVIYSRLYTQQQQHTACLYRKQHRASTSKGPPYIDSFIAFHFPINTFGSNRSNW